MVPYTSFVFPACRDGAGAVVEHAELAGRAVGPRPAELAVERGGAIEHTKSMDLTCPTSQRERSPLNEVLFSNMQAISLTRPTSQLERLPLNEVASWNIHFFAARI